MSSELLHYATQALAVPVSAGIFINGVEELLIDAQYFARGLYRRERRAITLQQLDAAPRQRIAIMVAAWHEADVIESMLEHNRRNLDYPPELFDIFCGTYQNDPGTQERVSAVVQRYTNVHKVVVPHDGPTSKADCLNWIYQGIVLEEKRRGQRFDILLMHDAEDLIHPLAPKLYSLMIPRYEFVQTPVFSLPLPKRDVISSTYIDEFAEHHLKDMLVREAMGGLVPSAGVGSAFARDAFEEIAVANDQHPFNVDSLTEDYEVGLKFRLAGKRVHFALNSLQKTRNVKRWFGRGERQVVEEEIIATREYFPNTLATSIRQRARWITGIALQTWKQVGWQGSAAVRYCLWRDRKVIATNSLVLGAYGLVAVLGTATTFTADTTSSYVPSGSLLWWLMSFNLFVLAWRVAMKMNFVGRLYGIGHALASVPRLILANIIGLAATARAVRQYVHHLWTGEPLRWAKTAHEFPSFEVLATQQRRLGEFLVDHGKLTPTDIEDALLIQSGTDLPLGEVLSASGMMSARAITEALGENLSIAYAEPNATEVPIALLRRLPEQLAAELEAMPVMVTADGTTVIAMAAPPWPHENERLSAAIDGPVRIVLAERSVIRRGRWRAYRRLVDGGRRKLPLGEILLAAGVIDIAQLYDALEEQLETGERLGELLIRHGLVSAEQIQEALWTPYRAVNADDIDLEALRALGYGFATFYQLAPLRSPRGVTLACPSPVHPVVQDEAAHRLGRAVESALAASLEVRVALAIASRRAWPDGVAHHVPGLLGEELSAVLHEPLLVANGAALDEANAAGRSAIDYLADAGTIDPQHAKRLHAYAFGLDLVSPPDCKPAGTLLPPELAAEHVIRVHVADDRGLVLAAPNPTPQLARQVAELFVDRPIVWRVLIPPGELAAVPQRPISRALREAV